MSHTATCPYARTQLACPIFNFQFSIFLTTVYDIPMPEHIEDIQHRYDELKKRMELVRSYL